MPGTRITNDTERTPKADSTPPDPATRAFDLPGFGPLTRIATQMGDFPAQTLRVGDRVRTREGAFKRIVWLDRILLDETFLEHHPEAMPVLIRHDAFGPALPAHDVVLSPGQPIHGDRRHLHARIKRAGDLTGGPRVMRKAETMITYTLFHCGEKVDVCAEGLWLPVAP